MSFSWIFCVLFSLFFILLSYFILFCYFFIIFPRLFHHRLLVPWIFLFFVFQRQEVFLSPPGKSTKGQYSCGSRTYKFHYLNNTWIPGNAGSYKILRYILRIFDIFQYFRSMGVFFFLYHFLFLFAFHHHLYTGDIYFFYFLFISLSFRSSAAFFLA